MFHPPSFTSLLLIFAVLILVFGNRLPSIGKSLGEAMRNFKKGLNDDEAEGATLQSSPKTDTLLEEIQRIKQLLAKKETEYLLLKSQETSKREREKTEDYIDV